MSAVKQITGAITKTLGGKERTFALNMRALCTLEDDLSFDAKAQKKLENAILQENRRLKAQVEHLRGALNAAGIDYKDEPAPQPLFLGLLDLQNMSNSETVTLVRACLETHHPDLTIIDLIDEMGTLEQSRKYVEAVFEAIVISQGTGKAEHETAPEGQTAKKGKAQS